MRFSLIFFANDDARDARSRYDLLARSAEFADDHGFEAVWVPERHFHSFGGAFPNPAIAACLVAMNTSRIRVRVGSVVLPVHDVLSVAEDWSMVDNLSGGRVDISFATGWNPADFVLAPERYATRQDCTLSMAREFDRLWKGESIRRTDGMKNEVDIRVYPRPVQRELQYWLTCTSTPERFVQAGENGFNVLTALLFQTPDEVRRNIDAYRAARYRDDASAGPGHVTLMLHTYLDESLEAVRNAVRVPFIQYLESSISLWKNRWTDLENIPTERDRKLLLELAFSRYFRSAGLFGTVDSCLPTVQKFAESGVDEIACLVDFGMENEVVLEGLKHVARLVAASA